MVVAAVCVVWVNDGQLNILNRKKKYLPVVMKEGLETRRVCGNGCGGCGCGSLNFDPHQTHTRYGGFAGLHGLAG